MKRNIDKNHGVILSQRVLLKLIERGMAREVAYDIVQSKAMHAWETETHFKQLVEADEEIRTKLTQEEINDCFDYTSSSNLIV